MIFGKRRPPKAVKRSTMLVGGAWDPYWPPKKPSADAVRPGDDPVPTRPADMPSGWKSDPRAFAPHCDQRILHAPGECWACDLYPDWQELRGKWGIAFTGQAPLTGVAGNQLPCPADYNRPPGSKSDHTRWGPNTAQGARRG